MQYYPLLGRQTKKPSIYFGKVIVISVSFWLVIRQCDVLTGPKTSAGFSHLWRHDLRVWSDREAAVQGWWCPLQPGPSRTTDFSYQSPLLRDITKQSSDRPDRHRLQEQIFWAQGLRQASHPGAGTTSFSIVHCLLLISTKGCRETWKMLPISFSLSISFSLY